LGNRIKLGMIEKINVKIHREIQGEIKTATFVRDVDQCFTAICVKGPKQQHNQQQIPIIDENVGVDPGIKCNNTER
jgi:hypothetical protein